jgi:hypothetical protein
MGFHVVNIENGKLKHDYVETYEELSYVEFITNDSIVYQGEEHWKPFKVSDNERYKHFAKGWFRAGIQAQELFKEQATSNGYILEMLNQDQKSFKSYTSNVNSVSIKRGDFLIRNFGNIEIDVKCRGFREVNGEKTFDFKCEDAIKHQNMQLFTNTPILIAVYENVDDRPVDDTIYLFTIDKLMDSKKIEINQRDGIGKCYQIPLSFTKKGFSLIDNTYYELILEPSIPDLVKLQSQLHKNAYSKWNKEDDEKLEILFCEGLSVSELSKEFGRNNGAIRSRINKLELKLKYGCE